MGFEHSTPAAVSGTRLRSVKDVFHFCGMGCTRVFPIYFKCCWYLMRLEELGREAADEKRRQCSWTQIVQMYPQELQLGCVVTAGQDHTWPDRKMLLYSPFYNLFLTGSSGFTLMVHVAPHLLAPAVILLMNKHSKDLADVFIT